MIWLALASALTAWAGVAAYGIWAWRDDRRSERAEVRETHERTEKGFERIQNLIRQYGHVRNMREPPADFPARGDNFTTLKDDKVVEFGKRPKPETPDGGSVA